MISPFLCATEISATGNGTENRVRSMKAHLTGLPWEPGCRSDLDSAHGQSGAVRGKPVAHPAQTPNGGKPTMAQGLLLRRVGKASSRFASDLAGSCGEAGARTPIMCQNSLVQPAPVRRSPQGCQPDWSSLLPADMKMVSPF